MKKFILLCIALCLAVSGVVFIAVPPHSGTGSSPTDELQETATTGNHSVSTGQATPQSTNRNAEKKRFLHNLAVAAKHNRQAAKVEAEGAPLQLINDEQQEVQQKLAQTSDKDRIAQLESYQSILLILKEQIKEQTKEQ